MKIGIIGGGYSGILCALLIKKQYPDYDVIIIEQNNQIGKKIKATGNGKCNIDNKDDDKLRYNDPEFMDNLMDDYDIADQVKCLKTLGIYVKDLGHGGLYPASESANNVVEMFEQELENLDVKTYLETKVLQYKVDDTSITINTDKHDFVVDKMIIATGGMSTPNLGSDGNFVDVIKEHGYTFKDFKPGLCPIRVSDHVKNLFGERVKANVQVLVSGKTLFEEFGEVNFKKDGLSGIVMMNAASAIARENLHGAMIQLDIKHDLKVKDIIRISKTLDNPLLTVVNKPLADYIFARSKVEQHLNLEEYEAEKILNTLSHLRFRFESLYDFKDSQVSVGGVLLENINKDTFESNLEKNVYFAGETLNIDGFCGGFNMKFGLCCAMAITANIND